MRPEISRVRSETRQEVREIGLDSRKAIIGLFAGVGGLYLKMGYEAYQYLQAVQAVQAVN